MPLDDEDLVQRCLRDDDDDEAFGELVERYKRLALSIAYGIVGGDHAARDVAQDAFIKAHDRLGDLRNPSRFRSWFYGVVRTTALDWLRRHKRDPHPMSGMDGREKLLPDPEAEQPPEAVTEAERDALVRREVAELRERYRELIVLKYLEGKTYKEIAELTGLTVSAVESRLHRARAKLRDRLESLQGLDLEA